MDVKIEAAWKEQLAEEFNKSYFKQLTAYIKDEYNTTVVYPPPKYLFRAFDLCPFDQVNVVILGQDPYHGTGQAVGLSFAVDKQTATPPSLQNIFKEIEKDFGTKLVHTDGDLSRWARQGVLLLNATLTVRAQSPGSHQGKGWELFTDAAISALSRKREHIVFLLWGNNAKQKGILIDRTRHLVLESPHPSPFSANNGFFDCKHFSKANEYLKAHGKSEIYWL